jgi:hypothetical protein
VQGLATPPRSQGYGSVTGEFVLGLDEAVAGAHVKEKEKVEIAWDRKLRMTTVQ